MTFTVHPTPGTEVQSQEFAEHLKKILSMLDRVESGYAFLSPSGLTASLGEGKAFISGYEVGEAGDGSEPLVFASATSNQGVYLGEDGSVTVDTVAPGGITSIKVWEVDTGVSTIDDTRDLRSDVSAFSVALQSLGFTATGADPHFTGYRVSLAGLEPYWDMEDTTGAAETITRIRAEGGALNLYDVDTGTFAETLIIDLRDLGSLPFIPLSEKGANNGVATLGAGGLIPTAQLPAATSSVQGAVILSNAAAATLAAANAQGSSTRVARQDHVHAHGDRSADGGTNHTMTQIGGVITDTQHGSRGGAALHSLATGGAHGFMAAADKAKLDTIESGATADQTASEILALLITVDGAGSGLDSDLLDGQSSAFYQDASNLNAGLIALARLPTVLTGKDADLLDGQHGAYYRDASNLNAGTVADARLPTTQAGKTFTSEVSLDGGFEIGAQNIFASDGDIASSWIPDGDNTRDFGSPSRRFQDGYFVNVHTGDFLMSDTHCAVTGALLKKGHRLGFKVIAVEEKGGLRELRTIPFIITNPITRLAHRIIKFFSG